MSNTAAARAPWQLHSAVPRWIKGIRFAVKRPGLRTKFPYLMHRYRRITKTKAVVIARTVFRRVLRDYNSFRYPRSKNRQLMLRETTAKERERMWLRRYWYRLIEHRPFFGRYGNLLPNRFTRRTDVEERILFSQYRHSSTRPHDFEKTDDIESLMSVEQAKEILSITPDNYYPRIVAQNFARMFLNNQVSKGGSYYILTRLYTAKKVLDKDMKRFFIHDPPHLQRPPPDMSYYIKDPPANSPAGFNNSFRMPIDGQLNSRRHPSLGKHDALYDSNLTYNINRFANWNSRPVTDSTASYGSNASSSYWGPRGPRYRDDLPSPGEYGSIYDSKGRRRAVTPGKRPYSTSCNNNNKNRYYFKTLSSVRQYFNNYQQYNTQSNISLSPLRSLSSSSSSTYFGSLEQQYGMAPVSSQQRLVSGIYQRIQ